MYSQEMQAQMASGTEPLDFAITMVHSMPCLTDVNNELVTVFPVSSLILCHSSMMIFVLYFRKWPTTSETKNSNTSKLLLHHMA